MYQNDSNHFFRGMRLNEQNSNFMSLKHLKSKEKFAFLILKDIF